MSQTSAPTEPDHALADEAKAAMFVTDDPVTAALYGVLAYPSLRPGVTTTVDLLAGQPGPWELLDVERAQLAADLAGQLATAGPQLVDLGSPLPGVGMAPVDPTVALFYLVQACGEVRGLLADPVLSGQPPAIVHELLELDDRAARFVDTISAALTATAARDDDVPVQSPPRPAPPASAPRLPAVPDRPAAEWRRDELLAFLIGAGLDPSKVLAWLRERCTEHAKPEPRTWAEVVGNTFRLKLVLEYVTAYGTGTTAEAAAAAGIGER